MAEQCRLHEWAAQIRDCLNRPTGLNNATCFKAVYIVTGYTDLRSGMDRLAAAIELQTGNKPYVTDSIFSAEGGQTESKALCGKGTASVCCMIYTLILLYLTLLGQTVKSEPQMELAFLWEYRLAVQGYTGWWVQIFDNIMLFVPMGWLWGLVYDRDDRGVWDVSGRGKALQGVDEMKRY